MKWNGLIIAVGVDYLVENRESDVTQGWLKVTDHNPDEQGHKWANKNEVWHFQLQLNLKKLYRWHS